MKILGINCRNLDFIQRYNKRKFFPRADNKILCKALAQQYGIQVPGLIKTIEVTGQVRSSIAELKGTRNFVLKPARGSGGDGIMVFQKADDSGFLRLNGDVLTESQVCMHSANILHGMYSLGGVTDLAFVEEKVEFDNLFEHISFQGTPDVRVIVFQGVPVMAMLRLPTRQSGGRANLHQGAIGVGIDVRTGETRGGFIAGALANSHPDTGHSTSGLYLPHWNTILRYSSLAYEFSELGYLGVDLVYDQHKGPMLLEINARPGLSIQVANRMGLIKRLRYVEQQSPEKLAIDDRLALLGAEEFN
jgi:alpha-L-glutamate ligase-like protein